MKIYLFYRQRTVDSLLCDANVNSILASFDVGKLKLVGFSADVFMENFDYEWRKSFSLCCEVNLTIWHACMKSSKKFPTMWECIVVPFNALCWRITTRGAAQRGWCSLVKVEMCFSVDDLKLVCNINNGRKMLCFKPKLCYYKFYSREILP